MNKKTFDLIIKIILSVLAIASGILAFILRWPSYSAVEAAIFGIAYFIAAISFWFADKKILGSSSDDCSFDGYDFLYA